jgi:Lrp/AsnC family leucine-responsive transcriptional regulator
MTFDSQKLLDKTGWALLLLLQENARLSFAELGKRVGLTAPGVADRIHRMEDAGIITRYRVEINLSKVGLPINAIMRVTGCEPSARFAKLVQTVVEVRECHRVTGSDCFILKLAVSSTAHLEALIDMFEPYGQITTMLVLSTPVADRIVGPEIVEMSSKFAATALVPDEPD